MPMLARLTARPPKFFRHSKKGRAYVFEPNPAQFAALKQNLREYKNAEIFPYGAYDQNMTLRFSDLETTDSRITDTGTVSIDARKLDDVLQGKKVTFIKMDIEGAELAALRGAEKIIREQRPKLAICVYHKPEDIWEIPSLILSYNPDYRLYLRHYSITEAETVLYAI